MEKVKFLLCYFVLVFVFIVSGMFTNVLAFDDFADGLYVEAQSSKAKDKPSEEGKQGGSVTKGFDKSLKAQCPRSLITLFEHYTNECYRCHIEGTFEVKETPPDATMVYPDGVKVVNDTMYYKLYAEISFDGLKKFEEALDYLKWHPNIKNVHISILSPGGSLFVAWQYIARIEMLKSKYNVTTFVPGFAASAAFLIWVGGNERVCYEHSVLMHHELWSFEFFKIEDVSDTEESARVKRFLQDNIHDYLLKRCILTREQLDNYVKGVHDYWMNGKEALEVGFATKIIDS